MKNRIGLLILLLMCYQFAKSQSDETTETATLEPSRIFVSYGPSGAFIKTKESDGAFGGGSALTVGWYFNSKLALYLTSKGYHMQRTKFTNDVPGSYFRWGVNGVGIRYSLVEKERTHLFLDGAFLQSSITPDLREKIIFSGNGFSAGVGMNHFVAPRWSISVDLVYAYSQFRKRVEDDRTIDFDLRGHGANISAGFAWHPYANR